MIPNITRGSRMAGLMVYLASTDADKTKNAHTDPHLVPGDAAIMAWYDDGVLDHEDAMAIAKHLDQPRKAYGVEVRQKDFRWDQAAKRRVQNGYKQADVWHCSLSLRAEEGAADGPAVGRHRQRLRGRDGLHRGQRKGPVPVGRDQPRNQREREPPHPHRGVAGPSAIPETRFEVEEKHCPYC